jgi:hypothetical protein
VPRDFKVTEIPGVIAAGEKWNFVWQELDNHEVANAAQVYTIEMIAQGFKKRAKCFVASFPSTCRQFEVQLNCPVIGIAGYECQSNSGRRLRVSHENRRGVNSGLL